MFTPIINYGGGVDASQRFIFDYNQILSGGNLKYNLTFDSNLEKLGEEEFTNNQESIQNLPKDSIEDNGSIENNDEFNDSDEEDKALGNIKIGPKGIYT